MNTNNSALLLIEFQNEWLREEGKLNSLFIDWNQFSCSLKNAEKAIMAARESSFPIIHSGLNFTESYSELGQTKHGLRAAIPQHRTFLAATPASAFAPPFVPQKNEFLVQGRVGSSAFSGSNLDIYLRNNHIGTLYIMGYALHVCVESTIRAAHDLGYEAVIIEDATSAFTQEQNDYFFKNILHHFGSKIKTNDFIKTLKRGN